MSEKVMQADAVRSEWRDVMDQVVAGGTVLVERYRKPVVAVISYEDYLAVRETLEDLQDIRLAEAALAEYRRDPSRAMPVEEYMAARDAKDVTAKTNE
jgi:prevent-host-death family protein